MNTVVNCQFKEMMFERVANLLLALNQIGTSKDDDILTALGSSLDSLNHSLNYYQQLVDSAKAKNLANLKA